VSGFWPVRVQLPLSPDITGWALRCRVGREERGLPNEGKRAARGRGSTTAAPPGNRRGGGAGRGLAVRTKTHYPCPIPARPGQGIRARHLQGNRERVPKVGLLSWPTEVGCPPRIFIAALRSPHQSPYRRTKALAQRRSARRTRQHHRRCAYCRCHLISQLGVPFGEGNGVGALHAHTH
jgi:hypothetical protein